MVQRIPRNAARREIGQHRVAILPGLVGAVDLRDRGIGHRLAARGHADHPRRHAVRVEGVLVGAVVPRREHDRDPLVVDFLARLVDRILRIERTARAPRVVHDLDVVVALVIQDVIEARERPENEQDVTGADADELRARSDTRVVPARCRAEARRDSRDVGAVAHRRLAVGQVLDEQLRRLRGLVERALEREQVREIDQHFDVLDRLVGIVQVGVVQAVDPRIENRDPHALPRDPRRLNGVGPDRRHALVQHRAVAERLVRVHALHRRQRRDRADLGRRRERRHEVEVVELDDAGADSSKSIALITASVEISFIAAPACLGRNSLIGVIDSPCRIKTGLSRGRQ